MKKILALLALIALSGCVVAPAPAPYHRGGPAYYGYESPYYYQRGYYGGYNRAYDGDRYYHGYHH